MNYETTKEILENQVHGGMIICENVRNVFHAVSKGEDGGVQTQILLMSLPTDELDLIKPNIEKIKKQFEPKISSINNIWLYNRPNKQSDRQQLHIEEMQTRQLQSIALTQIVIDYLKSIGQWWNKRQSVPVSIVTDSENDLEHEEQFKLPD